jgi:phage tail-like protein
VHLTRSLPGPTLAPPPQLRLASTPRIGGPRPPARTGTGTNPSGAPPPPVSAPGRLETGSDRLGDGGFQECTGLELEADLHEYLEGGGNDVTVRRLGRAKHVPVILKRGMLVPTPGGSADPALWAWMHAAVTNQLPLPRFDGLVEVMDPPHLRVLARWTFMRALPLKVVGPVLNATSGAIAMEEIHLAHEGIRLERVP